MVRGASWVARRPIARLGRFGLFVRCLIGLYLISLAAAAQAAVPVVAREGGGLVLELCTADGVRRVVIDDAGQTSDRHDSGHHAGHDCAGCCIRCPPKALAGRASVALVHLAPSVGHIRDLCGSELRKRRATTRAPLPPRGPPAFS